MKTVFLFCLVLFVVSCSSQKTTPKSDPAIGLPRKDLVDQLQSQNVYVGVQTSKVDSEYEEILGSDDQRFFLKSGKVISKIRNATKKERALAFWRERFKGKLYRERALKNQGSVHGHQDAWIELACDTLGTGVIFDPAREQVVKVFYYETQE